MANWIDFTYPEPEIGVLPPRPPAFYEERLTAIRNEMRPRALDTLVVYADREHFANLTFLTGYDPRFEESLLLLPRQGEPLLLVGNEGWAYASLADKSGAKLVKCQTFSLQGQPRGGASLMQILTDFGIAAGSKVGLVGTKTYGKDEVADPRSAHDVPSYIVDTLRSLATVTNETDILIDPSNGYRVAGLLTTAYDIAEFEYAAEVAYSGARRLLLGLKPGISEVEAAASLGHTGHPPLSYHIAVGFGEDHVSAGLGSPDPSRRLTKGDPITFGYGVWGGNVARAGLAVADESELSAEAVNYVEELAVPYLRCLRDWYEALAIGRTGGDVFSAVRRFVEDPRYGVTLNPGHLLHLDEWPSTPFYLGSKDVLRSGTFIQCDIIAAPGAPYHGIHTEDGLVLADKRLRAELETEFPLVAARIARRREMMRDELGFDLAPDVLPLCSAQACVCPFLLAPNRVLTLS